MNRPRNNKIPPRGKTRFPQIGTHAQELGVERSHLYRVLNGERVSASLMRRYQALTRNRKAAV
jgi:hypothetical protein